MRDQKKQGNIGETKNYGKVNESLRIKERKALQLNCIPSQAQPCRKLSAWPNVWFWYGFNLRCMLTMSFGVVPSAPGANCNVPRGPKEGEEPGCEKLHGRIKDMENEKRAKSGEKILWQLTECFSTGGIVGCLAAPANDTGKTLHLLVHARKAPAPYKTKHEEGNHRQLLMGNNEAGTAIWGEKYNKEKKTH